MKNHFYHSRWAPLSATIFITHVRILRNGSYVNGKRIEVSTWHQITEVYRLKLYGSRQVIFYLKKTDPPSQISIHWRITYIKWTIPGNNTFNGHIFRVRSN